MKWIYLKSMVSTISVLTFTAVLVWLRNDPNYLWLLILLIWCDVITDTDKELIRENKKD